MSLDSFIFYTCLSLKDYYLSMLGTASFKKAIEEAEKLSESLKLRSVTSLILSVFSVL